jgi:hypothetical protein
MGKMLKAKGGAKIRKPKEEVFKREERELMVGIQRGWRG